jgi:hypothetical protein
VRIVINQVSSDFSEMLVSVFTALMYVFVLWLRMKIKLVAFIECLLDMFTGLACVSLSFGSGRNMVMLDYHVGD